MEPRTKSPSPSKKIDPEKERILKEALRKRTVKGPDFFSKYAYHIVIGGFVGLILIALFTTFFSGSKKLNTTPVIELDEIQAHNN